MRAPFDFDDREAITENVSIQQLWPASVALHPPALGTAVSGRPVVNYSFALNEALNRRLGVHTADFDGPRETLGFHAVNVLLHVITALLLFGFIRRAMTSGRVPSEWQMSARYVAAVASALWLAHPIQTEAVDYISQRSELLVSLFYVAAMYAAAKAWERQRWSIAAVALSLLGMLSKEVMITVPLMVLLYDRAFIVPTWPALLASRKRVALYVALFATSGVSLWMIASGARGDTAGFNAGMKWYDYLVTQGWAIPHYLRLVVFPAGLTFDYGRVPVHGASAVVGLVALSLVAIGVVYVWTRPGREWLGFLGAWFFVLLAPSSSIVPIRTEIAAERRIYLALAAVVVLVVVGLVHVFRNRRTTAHSTFAVVGLMLVVVTMRRSAQYDDLVVRWRDGVAKTPANGRAYDNLASALLRANPPRIAEADSVLHEGMKADSTFVPLWVRSASIAQAQNNLVDAAELLEYAIRHHPGDVAAMDRYGDVLIAANRPDLALKWVKRIAEFRGDGASLGRLGMTYLMLRQVDSAVVVLERAALVAPANVVARRYLASALIEQNRGAEAIPYLRQALVLNPESGVTLGLQSLAFAQAHMADSAVNAAADAVHKLPPSAVVYVFAGRAMSDVGRFDDAVRYLEEALRISPNDSQASARLAAAKASLASASRRAQ